MTVLNCFISCVLLITATYCQNSNYGVPGESIYNFEGGEYGGLESYYDNENEEAHEFFNTEEYNSYGENFNQFGSGSGEEDSPVLGTFTVTFKAKFKSRLSDETSVQFERLAGSVNRKVTSYLGEELVLEEDEIQVQVLSFDPVNRKRQTQATVSVELIPYAQAITLEQLTAAMMKFSKRGRINGKKVTDVAELELPDIITETEVPGVEIEEGVGGVPVDHDVIIIINKRFKRSLGDETSTAFQQAKNAVEEELRLFLTAGGEISQLNLIGVNVREFERRPRRSTAAIMTITVTNTPQERLNAALQNIVGSNLDEAEVLSAELIPVEEPVPLEPNPSEPTPFEPTPFEPTPSEPTPPEPTPFEPTPPEPTISEPAPTEPTPPQVTNRGDNEPSELPDHCQNLSSLENGGVSCSESNEILSTCDFSCSAGYFLRGSSSVTCQEDGRWSGEIPYCEILTCPEIPNNFPHKVVECSNENQIFSICSFRCDQGYEISGSRNITCNENGEWSAYIPECQLIPVDCVIEYRTWSACEDNRQYKEGYVVQEAVGTGTPCPSPVPYKEQECADCRIAWQEWGRCTDGFIERSEYVTVEVLGASEPCPELQTEREACTNCELAWGDWEECSNGQRIRTQTVSVEKQGGGDQCPPPRTESQICVDCEIGWGEWGECSDGLRAKQQVILQEPIGFGRSCPPLTSEEEICIDCEIEWGEWGECDNGERVRNQVVYVSPIGAGDKCPNLEEEREACIDCELRWGEWGVCANGLRERSQVIASPPIGEGRPCPVTLETEQQDCIDCAVEWGPWSECYDHEQFRDQYVAVDPVGEAAQPCSHLDRETRECFDCELIWDDWSACEDGFESREQIVFIEPEGGGRECEFKPPQRRACADCQLSWGEWGKCIDGKISRSQYVSVEAAGSGLNCFPIETQTKDCSSCVLGLRSWSECRDGLRSREQYIISEPSEGGDPCPSELNSETEDCVDCELAWASWSSCYNGSRVRYQYIIVRPLGAGRKCPPLERAEENCVHCELEWGEWGLCEDGKSYRSQFVAVEPVGAGDSCDDLTVEQKDCADCSLEWGEYGKCRNGESSRTQNVVTPAVGGGRPCPAPQNETQACADCELEWEEWSECEDGRRTRTQEIIIQQLGNGKPCSELKTEAETCGIPDDEDVLCRYTRQFLGYGGNRNRRDILLLGDESGSIGWINYEKIKNHFKAVVHQLRGGVDSEHAQFALMSFAGWTRAQFGFDDYNNADDLTAAIDRSKYHGGHRSKIGQALIEANTWMFQQSEGMRSFPGHDDDDITHEILIATDGCRTSSGYYLLKGLRKIRKRGIKLSVLGIESHDPRCREALQELRTDEIDVYEVGNWDSLDAFTRKIERRVCQPLP